MIAVLLVTHNAQRWLPGLLASIDRQTQHPDICLAVDDSSTDATRDLLDAAGFQVIDTASRAVDLRDRVAENVVTGLRALSQADVVVLGDHDDVWHPHRIAHQVRRLADKPDVWLTSADGRIIGDAQGTLRQVFTLPITMGTMSPSQRLRFVLRHSVATGGACAIRNAALLETPAVPVPRGWLHDRWWSILAAAQEALDLDEEIVIDYRVQPEQQVGLDSGRQASRSLTQGRIADIRRLRDLMSLRAYATSACAPELRPARLLATVLS